MLQCRPPPAVMELPHPLCGAAVASSLLRFLLVQTQTHSATAAVESMDSWSTARARPPAPARPPGDLGVTLTAAGPGRGEGINGFVSRSSIIPHPISLEPSNMARHSAGLALDFCTLLHQCGIAFVAWSSHLQANLIGLLLMLLPSLPRALLQLPTEERTTKYIA